MIGDFLFRKQILERPGVGAPEKSGHGHAMPVIGEGGGDVDAFAAGIRSHALDAIDRAGREIANRDGAIDRGVERDGDDVEFFAFSSCGSVSLGVRQERQGADFLRGMAGERLLREGLGPWRARVLRSCALIEAMLGTLMLSSATPRPARIMAPRGSPATPPQTPTHFPAAVAARTTWSISRKTTGCNPSTWLRERRMHPIHREHVLREVVRPDGKEIDFAAPTRRP